ncbi:hypothetical protein DERP_007563 [Dermatophagoides pteronyssinus]|uniref:Uncharacterized protein n=1 Tax=Dermatophagoides pteronyssinus TaxID=6956 RepID=A0ABQ8JKK1_DERPT|nr:hypothetical protein DERP_007563 [Dermatophagoides pteronyssinus]
MVIKFHENHDLKFSVKKNSHFFLYSGLIVRLYRNDDDDNDDIDELDSKKKTINDDDNNNNNNNVEHLNTFFE